MTLPSLTYTATFDANLAREIGLAPAILYNILLWQSTTEIVQNYDPDGWFYLTAKRFEEMTTYSVNWFTKASNKLAEVGLIEKKKMFRHDCQGVSCLHFRVLKNDWKSYFNEIGITESVRGTHTKCDSNIIEENKKKNADFTISAKSNEIASSASLGENPPMDEPFGEEVKRTSVRPSQKDDGGRKCAYAVANNVRKRLQLSGQSTAPYKQLIARWLECGFTEDDIVDANLRQMHAKDGFHETLSPMARLSGDSMDWYREQINKEKARPAEYQPEEYYQNPEVDENGRIIMKFDV